MASCLAERKQVQDKRFDIHLGVRRQASEKESFNWLMELIAHYKKAFH